MRIVLTGSVAFDYLMTFPGRFRDHILTDQLERISLSFLVDSLTRRPGGVAANIAYTLALLGEKPVLMATVGEDFDEQLVRLRSLGIDTSAVHTVKDLQTASFFGTTDLTNAQIATFYTGAMAKAKELRFSDLKGRPELVVISPNDPQAMKAYVSECLELCIPYVYDPSQQIIRLDKETLAKGIEGCTALFVSDYEFGLIREKLGWARKPMAAKGKLMVITRGENGADLHFDGQLTHVPAVKPVRIVDPTGIGDAFRGGFLKGHVNKLSLERCGQMGVLAATYCLEDCGPQGHHYDLPSFIARFRQHFDDQGELDALM